MPFTIITGGSYTSTGANQLISMPSSVDYFTTTNFTQMPLAPATAVCIRGEWFGSKFGVGASAANDGIRWKKTNSTNAINIDTFATATASNGFNYLTSHPVVEAQAANAITAISAANPAVVSQTNTYITGDIIRIYNTTGDLTIGGMDFQISSVSGSAYTLLGLANVAGNGLAAATAGNTRRVGNTLLAPLGVNPEMMYITNISAATNAVVSTSVDPSLWYSVGMAIHFSVPSSFGMVEINQLTGTIIAVNAVAASSNIGAYNVTVNINSAAFTAFAFPVTGGSPTKSLFATFAPAGASTQQNTSTGVFTGYDFTLQPFRNSQFIPAMIISGGAQSPGGANADVIDWVAYKFET